MPEAERPNVEQGDRIGWVYESDIGAISYDDTSGIVYQYNFAGPPGPITGNIYTFMTGNELQRTFSIGYTMDSTNSGPISKGDYEVGKTYGPPQANNFFGNYITQRKQPLNIGARKSFIDDETSSLPAGGTLQKFYLFSHPFEERKTTVVRLQIWNKIANDNYRLTWQKRVEVITPIETNGATLAGYFYQVYDKIY